MLYARVCSVSYLYVLHWPCDTSRSSDMIATTNFLSSLLAEVLLMLMQKHSDIDKRTLLSGNCPGMKFLWRT